MPDAPAKTPRKIVLAYSGGLDTSVVMPWLKETYPGCEIVAFVGDVGQGDEELDGIEKKAKRTGASSCHVVDLRREFVEEYVFPTLIAGSVYEGRYLLGTSMARPVLAKAQVAVARKVGADAVAHGCTGKGNDQVRFESTFAALAPDLQVIAPWRTWNLRSREQLLAYLAERNIPCSASATKIYSRDRNLWHISHEGGALENPWNPPPDDIWTMTADPRHAPDKPRDVTIAFEKGRPLSIDGKKYAPEQIISVLNDLASPHGVGRVDLIENRLVGMKSRGCYETPGGTVLMEALRALEELVLDRDTRQHREELSITWGKMVYDGRWFTPLREALWAALSKIAEPLTGEVVVRLFKGGATAIRRRSPSSLYNEQFATFGADEVYNQAHAEGFIRLYSLPSRIRAMKTIDKAAGRTAAVEPKNGAAKPASKAKSGRKEPARA
ncbi:MAG: argininosuccinate synthase [Phycisphaerales bacterium]|nr:argininosuccinate synthase [Phycisphaerales bacterium]